MNTRRALLTLTLLSALSPSVVAAQDDPRPWWDRGVSVPPGEENPDDARDPGTEDQRPDDDEDLNGNEDGTGREDANANANANEDANANANANEDANEDANGNADTDATAPETDDAPSAWSLTPYGFIRAGYEYVQNDSRYDFIGENDGFILANARAGLAGEAAPHGLSFRLSVEGAADLRGVVNSPEADLAVRLVDAFVQWDFASWLGARLGQFKVPFMAGWLGRDGALPFASRAVGLDGVPVGRGFELSGIVVDRELGLRVGAAEPIFFGDIGLAYWATVFNGNGLNELLNDNGRVAVAGRAELHYKDWVRLGGGVLWNARTEGPLPDRFDEEDVGFTADLTAEAYGVELAGHFTLIDTSFDTIASPTRRRMELHAQGGYALPFVPFPLVVGYRFAYFDPWQNGGNDGGVDLSTFELMYHTVGIRLHHPVAALGITAWVNYTFTVENQARQVDNDRLEVLVQLAF